MQAASEISGDDDDDDESIRNKENGKEVKQRRALYVDDLW